MKIAYAYTKGRPEGLETRAFAGTALGGSEASMIHYAQAFAKLGHEVTIFTPGAPSKELGGVKWHDFKGIHGRQFDVGIALRFPNALSSILAPLRVLYCCDPEIPELPEFVRAGHLQLVITIGQHQKERFQKRHPIPEHLYMMSNAGVTYSDYVGKNVEKVRGRCIYCSVPVRGLRELIQIWPMIHKQLPWATLHVTGGMALWGLGNPERVHPVIEEMMRLEGVTYLGVLPREELVREQLESELLLLPGNLESPEMCCISAMECAAAGNALVVTDIGALPERVEPWRTGFVVRREDGDRWQREFAGRACNLLEDIACAGLKEFQAQARTSVALFDYSVLALQWIARFEEELEKR